MIPTISHWIGQEQAIRRFKVALEAAHTDATRLPHMLFVGAAGTGKTTGMVERMVHLLRTGTCDQPRAMAEFNVALTVLSGESMGASQQAWLAWWRDAKKKLKVSPDRPQVADEIRRAWESYWNEKY